MNIAKIGFLLALVATPAIAQDASSSSELSSSEPLPAEPSSTIPDAPRGLDDAELEVVVRAAYTAAADFASAHGNYFARDGVFAPLQDAVATAVAARYATVVTLAGAYANLDAAKVCLAAPGTELRIASNTYGDGITLVAINEHRVFAYDYDPHQAAEIKVIPAADCIKSN